MTAEVERESPYKGLTPYDEGDADFFFGREKETKLIAASLFASPLTLLYGASGVGKSSVLRAGVVNLLRSRKDLLVVVFGQWQGDPLSELKRMVAQAAAAAAFAGDDRSDQDAARQPLEVGEAVDLMELLARERRAEELATDEKTEPPSSTEPIHLDEYLMACSAWIKRRLMLILDQFEEYSLYHPEDDAFALELPRAVAVTDLSVSILISLREDALARLDRFEGRIPTLFSNYRRIDHLDRAAAKQAIIQPINQFNKLQQAEHEPVSIEPELVEEVLDQVRTGQVVVGETGRGTITTDVGPSAEAARIETPYLQLVMTRLWQEEMDTGSPLLRLNTLYSLGGAEQIVQTHLDTVMAKFSETEKAVAASVFSLLVTPSGTKIAHMVRDLADYATLSAEELKPILDKLSQGSDRILRPVASLPEYPDEPRYEIFHDRIGPAILAWRTRYLKEQEVTEAKRLEAERLRFSQQYVKKAMDMLSAEEQELASRALAYLVTPSGEKVARSLRELATSAETESARLKPVLEKLSSGGNYILRRVYLPSPQPGNPQYEILNDWLIHPIFNWRLIYIQAQALTRSESQRPEARRSGAATDEASPESSSKAVLGVPPMYRSQREPIYRSPKEVPYRLIGDLLRRGKVVPFLGPGVSMASGLPYGASLAGFLAEESAFPDEFERSNLPTVASYYEAIFGRAKLNHYLYETFSEHEYEPSVAHRYLAEVAASTPLLIITMNYDTLIEQAFDEAGLSYDLLVNYPSGRDSESKTRWFRHGALGLVAVRDKEPLDPTATNVIVKLLGSVAGSDSGFIVTDRDYIELVTEMVIRSLMPRQIINHYRERSFLFLGWSLYSWSNRAMMYHLHGKERRTSAPRSWSLLRQPSPLELFFWQTFGIDAYDEGLNSFISRLRETAS